MAKNTVNIGTGTSDFIIGASDTRYVLKAGDMLSYAQILTDGGSTIDDIELVIDGVITGGSRAIEIGAADSRGNRIIVGETGVLDATDQAIFAVGQKTVISNLGAIFTSDPANSVGIDSTGDGARIVNGGYVKGGTGIMVTGNNNAVTNKGELATHMGGTGVVFDSVAGEVNRFFNTGYVDGGNAVEGGDGNERITNRGRMHGDVDLGAGDDVLVTTRYIVGDVYMGADNDRAVIRGKGDLTGIYMQAGDDLVDLRGANDISSGTTISGGLDDDTYIVARSDMFLHELVGQGTDTVRSTVSFNLGDNFENLILSGTKAIDAAGNAAANVLTGNAARNKVLGLDGMDTLDGGAGNDTLQGGTHADTFVVRANSGKDFVTDFTDLSDKIDLSAYDGIDGFGDLSGKIEQKGTDTVITLLDGDRITLANFTATNLTVADFDF